MEAGFMWGSGMWFTFYKVPWALLSDKGGWRGRERRDRRENLRHGRASGVTWDPRSEAPSVSPFLGPQQLSAVGLTLSEASLASGREAGSARVEKCTFPG